VLTKFLRHIYVNTAIKILFEDILGKHSNRLEKKDIVARLKGEIKRFGAFAIVAEDELQSPLPKISAATSLVVIVVGATTS